MINSNVIPSFFSSFRNVARPNSQFELATRFIALASVGNVAKHKFIYALNVTAVEKMRLTDLIQKTTNEIPCPYDTMKFSVAGIQVANAANDGNQFFYDFNATDDQQYRKRGKFNNQGGQQQHKRQRMPNIDQGVYSFLFFFLQQRKHFFQNSKFVIFFSSRKMLVLFIITIC